MAGLAWRAFVLGLALALAGLCSFLRVPIGRRMKTWLGFSGTVLAGLGGASIRYGHAKALDITTAAVVLFLLGTLGRVDLPYRLQRELDEAPDSAARAHAKRRMGAFLLFLVAIGLVIYFGLGQPGVRG